MYFVYNEAGKDDGPFTLDQLRAAVASGSLDRNKLARSSASADGWEPIHRVIDEPKPMHRYYIRLKDSQQFLGPFNSKELGVAIRDGQVPTTAEYVLANGQSRGALGKETNWRPVSDLGIRQSLDSTHDNASAAASPEFPALRTIAGLLTVMAVLAGVLGGCGFFAGLLLTNQGLVIAAAAWTLLVPLSLWATAEVILVLLQIEKNTRQQSHSAAVRVRGTPVVAPKSSQGEGSK